ncbi:hypothetical protein MMC30_006564 [Trapelia coarctata]|nr:hypothetical protein [Trapelia coarctata]
MAAPTWDQAPDFLAATSTALVPGGPTAYLVPRRTGNSPQDVTDFHPGQADWSRDNLPNILYLLESPPARNAFKRTGKPGPKRDQANRTVYECWPEAGTPVRPLRDFRVLPDRIGTKESWWVIEAWRRLDPRIEWPDIMMRMERPNRTKDEDKKISNCLNMFATRQRSHFGLISWHPRGVGRLRTDRKDAVIAKLTAAQRANNTTRGLMPGLINPALGEAGGRVPCPQDFEQDTRKRGPPKGRAKKEGNDEEGKGEDEDEEGEDEESSPAPSSVPKGPPRGIFRPTPSNLSQGPSLGVSYPAPTLQSNVLKRGRDDTADAADEGNQGRKRMRTTAPSAPFGMAPIPRAGPMPHNDPRLAEDMARYGINMNKRKADDSEAEAEPRKRKRKRRGMTDEEYIPAQTRARATRAPNAQPAHNADFLGRLDPALPAPPANPLATQSRHRPATAAMETRPRIEAGSTRTPTSRAHLPGARAPDSSETCRNVRSEAPWAHLPGARAPAGTETRRGDRMEEIGVEDRGRRAHLPGARAQDTTETRREHRNEARTTVREAPAPAARAHLPRERAQVATETRLGDQSEAPAPVPPRRAHLPGARAQDIIAVPRQSRAEEGQVLREHLPGARTQTPPHESLRARLARGARALEAQIYPPRQLAPGALDFEHDYQDEYQDDSFNGGFEPEPIVGQYRGPNFSGSMATYAGNIPWGTTRHQNGGEQYSWFEYQG